MYGTCVFLQVMCVMVALFNNSIYWNLILSFANFHMVIDFFTDPRAHV